MHKGCACMSSGGGGLTSVVAAIERLGQLATAGPASSDQVEPSSDVCRCCHRLLTCSPPPTWATCHQPPEAAPASTSAATLQPDFRNYSSEVQRNKKGSSEKSNYGHFSCLRRDKVVGERASRLVEDADSADDGIQEKDKYLAKCPFRCAVREEIGVSAAWRGISLSVGERCLPAAGAAGAEKIPTSLTRSFQDVRCNDNQLSGKVCYHIINIECE